MALPAIETYPMPSWTDVPWGKPGWTIEEGRSALLIHDMQRYFLTPFAHGESPLPQLVASIVALRRRCTSRGIPVFYSVQRGGQSQAERGLLRDFWGSGMEDMPSATSVIDDLAPSCRDTIIKKRRYSAFFATDLLEQMRAKGRSQLIICGVYAHIGCLATAMDAFMNDIQPFLVADAMADFSASHHSTALQQAAQVCGKVFLSAEVHKSLSTRSSHRRPPQKYPLYLDSPTFPS